MSPLTDVINYCFLHCGFVTGFTVKPRTIVPGQQVNSRLVIYSILVFFGDFLPRDAIHKRGLCRSAVSVSLSVCLSRSCILSKWINKSSKFFHCRVATSF